MQTTRHFGAVQASTSFGFRWHWHKEGPGEVVTSARSLGNVRCRTDGESTSVLQYAVWTPAARQIMQSDPGSRVFRATSACIPKEVTMSEHDNRTGHVPSSYALSSPHSAITAAAQRATKAYDARNEALRDAADMDRWEAEGGAAASRTRLQENSFQRVTIRARMSTRPSYDSSARSDVEAMVAGSGSKSARATVSASRPPSDDKRHRSKDSASSPGITAAKMPQKLRGRRTMGRRGNRP